MRNHEVVQKPAILITGIDCRTSMHQKEGGPPFRKPLKRKKTIDIQGAL